MPDRATQIAALSLPLDQLPDPLPIPPIQHPFVASITPPGSKSLTNRALLLAALADGESTLQNALIDADDTEVMLAAIQQLGARVKRAPSAGSGSSANTTLRITGVSGRWQVPPGQTLTLNLHNAGTATRFLAAAAILPAPDDQPALHRVQTGEFRGSIVIDGDERMRERPIGELFDALASIGARVEYIGRQGYPPLRVHPGGMFMFGRHEAAFSRTASGQFISALLLIAPWFPFGLTIRFDAPPTSEPYVRMTVELLKRLHVPVVDNLPRAVHIGSTADVDDRPQPPKGVGVRAFKLDIEPDASGATYFEAAAALVPASRVLIDGLGWSAKRAPLQGDTLFLGVIAKMGADARADDLAIEVAGPRSLSAIDFDLSDMPDTAMTAAALACFASPTPDNLTATSTLRGLRTLRHKESDRLAALHTELTKLGARIEIDTTEDDEILRITPPPPHPSSSSAPSPIRPIVFDTSNDHRLAMSLALVGLRRPNVFIKNPACVAKTYPTFWRDLARLYTA